MVNVHYLVAPGSASWLHGHLAKLSCFEPQIAGGMSTFFPCETNDDYDALPASRFDLQLNLHVILHVFGLFPSFFHLFPRISTIRFSVIVSIMNYSPIVFIIFHMLCQVSDVFLIIKNVFACFSTSSTFCYTPINFSQGCDPSLFLTCFSNIFPWSWVYFRICPMFHGFLISKISQGFKFVTSGNEGQKIHWQATNRWVLVFFRSPASWHPTR